MYRVTITSTKPLFISISQSFDECYKDIVRIMKIFKQQIPQEVKDYVKNRQVSESEFVFQCGEYTLTFRREDGSKN